MQLKYSNTTKEFTINITMEEIISLAKSANELQRIIETIKSLFGKK